MSKARWKVVYVRPGSLDRVYLKYSLPAVLDELRHVVWAAPSDPPYAHNPTEVAVLERAGGDGVGSVRWETVAVATAAGLKVVLPSMRPSVAAKAREAHRLMAEVEEAGRLAAVLTGLAVGEVADGS